MPDLQTTGLGETIYNIVRRTGYDVGNPATLIEAAVVDRCKVLRIHMTVASAISADTVLTLSNLNESQVIDTFTLPDTLGAGDTAVWLVNPDASINHFATGDRLSIATDGASNASLISTVVVTGRGGTSKGANDVVALGDNIVVSSQQLDVATGSGFEIYLIGAGLNGYLRRIVINQDGVVDTDLEIQVKLVDSTTVKDSFTLPAGGVANTVTIYDLPNDGAADLRQSSRNILRIDSDNAASTPPNVLLSVVLDVT